MLESPDGGTRATHSRRTFLGRGFAALGFPMIVPARVLGGPGAPSNRVTLAAIGCGGRGGAVHRGMASLEGVQYLAAVDPFRDRRERFVQTLDEQSRYGAAAKPCADFREALARGDIDAVVVCTPDHWHVPIAIAAARAGKDMYVEKPLGVSLRWAKVLREEARRRGIVFQYGTQQRSDPKFRFACELVRNGRIGELRRIEAWCADISSQYQAFHVKEFGSTEEVPVPEGFDYDLWLGPAPPAPFTVDRCTSYGAWHIYDYALGFIAGWGAHPLDIAQWGKDADHTGPVEYWGTGTLPSKGLYDTVSSWDVMCRYADGIEMRFMDHRAARDVIAKYRTASDHGTTFFGTRGWVSVDRRAVHASDPAWLRTKFGPGDSRLYDSPRHDQNFIDCARSRRPTICTLEAAIRSDTISHLSDIAVRTGRKIAWDPVREEIVGDGAAARMLDRPARGPWVV
ncbi:MAG: Gfo/Idh/MocA family oxidoreductase [Verrucomicrobiae bacterium]|nr:Gfo/Idh/MocA family oxidoreductase [Verrucomicrobiae bacterium]